MLRKGGTMRKIGNFFLTRMVVAIAFIAGLILLTEQGGRFFAARSKITQDTTALAIALVNAAIAVIGYKLVCGAYEKRKINELDAASFGKNAIGGLGIGLLLQSSFILVLFIAGDYSVSRVNGAVSLVSPFAFALEAGFVAEIVIIGIVFRLTEEKTGSVPALILFVLLFAALHVNVPNASMLSIAATAVHAGFMLPAAFMYGRNLWLPVFLHMGWDLAEPGIFGAINPSTTLSRGWLAGHLSGSPLLTGGASGPQDSVESLVLCLVTGMLFLWLARKKGRWVAAIHF